MIFGRRSQYATEYMVVIGFSLVILVPVILLMLGSYSDLTFSVSTYKAYSVSNEIVDNAIKMYSLGEGSMTTMFISIPERVIDSSIEDNEVRFRLTSDEDLYIDIYSVSPVNITGSLPKTAGRHRITVESRGDIVWIT